MKIGRSFDRTNLFDKENDTADDITEGIVKLFYPDSDKVKVGYLPLGAIAYLEIASVTEDPGTATDGDVIYNTTESKFKLYKIDTWVEVLFSMVEVGE
ncbi:unnamed protein product [marine sediment metagenome]|uniref:Uncharacterized protein n=1 Tax=marine sediment metagenome TaxID=412755 RepID=X1UL39_9ZZZZ